MQYLKVDWIHNFDDEPIQIYMELDEERYEVRKIELFKNGKFGFATRFIESEETTLSETPIPTLEDIEKDSEFIPLEISKQEFYKIWNLIIKK